MHSPIKVLVVDDEVGLRKLVKAMLESEDYSVDEAESGIEALEMVSQQDYSVIITDMVMPEVNGIDLILKLKERKYPAKVIAISGGGGITGRFDYLEISELIGANSILKKPFTEADIKAVVSQSLGQEEDKNVY